MADITKETAQKIDFLIQGVDDGKFDEVAKKIEFMKKLGGDASPTYLQDLLDDVRTLQSQTQNLLLITQTLETQHDEQKDQIERIKSEYNSDMVRVAKAIQWLLKPDPLATELYEIEQFINDRGARKY